MLELPDGEVVVTVLDEGSGFDPARLQSSDDGQQSFGLASIRERLELLGGRMELHSRPGIGTHAVLHVPLPSAMR
jgi:signal transduction histidine kinase